MMRLSRLTLISLSCLLIGCSSSGTNNSNTPSNTAAAAHSSHPLYAFNLMREGSILLQQGQFPEALNKFRLADRHQPGNATIHNMIGLCHLRLQRPEDALVAFNQAMSLVPAFTDARNNRGTAYLELRQFNLAEVDFLAVLADPTYPHRWAVLYNLGMAYNEQGQIGAAEENFRKAVTSPEPVAEAFIRLAEIGQESGKIDSAIDLLEEADLLFPERFEPALALGRLLMQIGRPEDAKPYLNKVILADPGSQSADEARSLLEGL